MLLHRFFASTVDLVFSAFLVFVDKEKVLFCFLVGAIFGFDRNRSKLQCPTQPSRLANCDVSSLLCAPLVRHVVFLNIRAFVYVILIRGGNL